MAAYHFKSVAEKRLKLLRLGLNFSAVVQQRVESTDKHYTSCSANWTDEGSRLPTCRTIVDHGHRDRPILIDILPVAIRYGQTVVKLYSLGCHRFKKLFEQAERAAMKDADTPLSSGLGFHTGLRYSGIVKLCPKVGFAVTVVFALSKGRMRLAQLLTLGS
ncbi:hypothetical protein M407DRAFT_16496 [Tulasnella calospora MUT 4182]|uniref:Uncharacterized protein n=1 Tax=Tulasnella calospora MUT 4182 TaxID=1051891 RepID=A0A0C3MLD1_9AGAM|nr:hypothetical protein M407DRAFT_16496 [Tulasnella calospora MUT 4182]